MQIKSVGIIGFGAMGQLIAEQAKNFIEKTHIKIVEANTLPSSFEYQKISFEELKTCDLIIPAVSAKSLKDVIIKLEELNLNGNQIVCSIAATMSYAEKILRAHLTSAQIVLTHPLFGPASLKENENSLKNLEVVLCLNYCRSANKSLIKDFLIKLGLIAQEINCKEHDQIMAKNHLIPFLLSHLLKDYDFIKSDFRTKSFNQLLKFLDHTSYNPGVLEEMITYNPYAQEELNNFKTLFSKYIK